MADYSDFIRNNIAPYAAKKIGVYNSSGTRVGSVLLGDFKPTYGERLYRVGLLSDVHNETSQADENSDDLINALKYFNEKESVEFVCISGDLTQTSYSTRDLTGEMELYKENLETAGIDKTIYVTTGNHDCPNNGTDVDIDTFYSYAGLSDIAPSSNAEYSYEVTKTHTTSDGRTVTDHFLFLTMKQYEFTTNTYSTTDITWLGNKLEEYKDDRCFVITHMFFPTYAGNLNDIYPSGNWLSGTMLTKVKALIDAYPRSIWFSGHSHWKWYLQKYQDRANIYPITNTDRTTGWAVHIPSGAYPIDSDGTTRVTQAGQSEGAIMDVYEDYIDIRGIEFKGADDTTYAQRYIPVAQYRLYTEPNSEQITCQITYSLGDVTSSSIVSTVVYGGSYSTDLSTTEGYSITELTVTMDVEDVTSSVVNGTHISIPSVTGDVEIYAMATEADFTITYDLGNSTSTNMSAGISAGAQYVAYITHSSGYKIDSIVLTMGENDVTSTYVSASTSVSDYTINIDSVDGDLEITVVTSVAYDTLVVRVDTKSAGIALAVPSSAYTYMVYTNIKITDTGNTDITSSIVSTDATSSNTYKVGTYNINSQYQYTPAGTVLSAQVNTNTSSSTGYQIPLVQASSSTPCTETTSNIYVQLKGIKISNNMTDWIEVNNGSSLLNGSDWGKTDLSYGWYENIQDSPAELTDLSTTGNTTTTS